MILSDNHKRIVFSTLKVVEDRIDEIERLIINDKKKYSYVVENDLSKEELENAMEMIRLTKEAISEMYLKYDIKPNVIILSRAINVLKAFIWKDISDTDSSTLSNYGNPMLDENLTELDKDLKYILLLTENLINR